MILSFYALLGVIDMLALLAQVVFTVLQSQGEYMMMAVPGLAILVNYFINWCIYKPLWDEIDPEEPKDDSKLTQEEVRRINLCDQWFNNWVEKYPDIAYWIRVIMKWWSHKIFHLPYTHFLGYQHFTLKTQDHRVVW